MRAVVVDDYRAFRVAAGRLLTAAGVDVVGSAADLEGARALIKRVWPDLVLIDVHLPDGDGFDLADELGSLVPGPHPTVLMTSSRSEADYRARLRKSTVAGFIAKDELSVERLHAVLGTR